MTSVITRPVRRLDGPGGSMPGKAVAIVPLPGATGRKSRNWAVVVAMALPLVTLALTAMPT